MQHDLKVAFAGTSAFAQTILAAIYAAGFAVPLVLTQPDRRAGRGMRLRASAVKEWAQAHDLALLQPKSLRLSADDIAHTVQAALRTLFTPDTQGQVGADVLLVVAYGLLLPQWLLDLPRFGCVNVHASLLPRWRGAAPIQRAIEVGDSTTGVTMIQMDAGLDTGAVLASADCDIASDASSASLFTQLAKLGADLCVQTLARMDLSHGPLPAQAQAQAGACYATKIEKAEARLNWLLPATELERKVRAFNPYPVAQSVLSDGADGEIWRIWRAQVLPQQSKAQAGVVLGLEPEGLCVAAGAGSVLALSELQRAGSKRLLAKDFFAGKPVPEGGRFVL